MRCGRRCTANDVEGSPECCAHHEDRSASGDETCLLGCHKRDEYMHTAEATGDVSRGCGGKNAHASDVVYEAEQGDAEYRAVLIGMSKTRCPIAAEDLVDQKIS